MRFVYRLTGRAQFLSHLDLMLLFARSARRAGLPIAYSEGFNPHPKLSLGPAHIVGIASLAEWGDMDLTKSISPGVFMQALDDALPAGLEVYGAYEMPPGTPALQASLSGADYVVETSGVRNNILETAVANLLAQESITYMKQSPKGCKELQLRPGIYRLEVENNRLEMELAVGDKCNVRPQYVLAALALPELVTCSILRTAVYIRQPDGTKKAPC